MRRPGWLAGTTTPGSGCPVGTRSPTWPGVHRHGRGPEAVDRHRRELIATVAHELRTRSPRSGRWPRTRRRTASPRRARRRSTAWLRVGSVALAGGEPALALAGSTPGTRSWISPLVQVALLLDAAVMELRAPGRQVDFAVEITPPDLVAQADPPARADPHQRARQRLRQPRWHDRAHPGHWCVVGRAVDPVAHWWASGVRDGSAVRRPAPDSPYADRPVRTLDITDEGFGLRADRVSRVPTVRHPRRPAGPGLGLAHRPLDRRTHGGRPRRSIPPGSGSPPAPTSCSSRRAASGPETAPSTPLMTRQAPATASHGSLRPPPPPGGRPARSSPHPNSPRPTTPGAAVSASDPPRRPAGTRGVSTRPIQDVATRPDRHHRRSTHCSCPSGPKARPPRDDRRLLALAVGVGAGRRCGSPPQQRDRFHTRPRGRRRGPSSPPLARPDDHCAPPSCSDWILIPPCGPPPGWSRSSSLSGAVVLVVAVTPARSVPALIGEAVAGRYRGLRDSRGSGAACGSAARAGRGGRPRAPALSAPRWRPSRCSPPPMPSSARGSAP